MDCIALYILPLNVITKQFVKKEISLSLSLSLYPIEGFLLTNEGSECVSSSCYSVTDYKGQQKDKFLT